MAHLLNAAKHRDFKVKKGLSVTEDAYVGGDLTVDGAFSMSGNLSAGNDLYVGRNLFVDGIAYLSAGDAGTTYLGDQATDKHVFTGKIGIGSATPNEALTVVGNISATGDVYMSPTSLIFSDNTGAVADETFSRADTINAKSVYTSSSETSGNWDSVYTSSSETSGNWDKAYTVASSNSANWNYVSSNSGSGSSTTNIVSSVLSRGAWAMDANTAGEREYLSMQQDNFAGDKKYGQISYPHAYVLPYKTDIKSIILKTSTTSTSAAITIHTNEGQTTGNALKFFSETPLETVNHTLPVANTPTTYTFSSSITGIGNTLGVGISSTDTLNGVNVTIVLEHDTTYSPPTAGEDVTRYDDLVHWWKFDESSGTTASDSVGSVNLSLDNGAAFAAGKNGNAVDHDGSDDMARSAEAAVTNFTSAGAYTFSIWVNFDVLTTWANIWHFDNTASGEDFLFNLMVDPSKINGYHKKASGGNAGLYDGTYSPGFSTGTWYHIAQTWDGTTVKLFVDGDEKLSAAASDVYAGDYTVTTGRYQVAAGTYQYPFNGKVDDFRIYDVALSTSEIGEVYNSGNGDW